MFRTTCKSCGMPILWVKTRSGKAMPCDIKPIRFRIDDSAQVLERVEWYQPVCKFGMVVEEGKCFAANDICDATGIGSNGDRCDDYARTVYKPQPGSLGVIDSGECSNLKCLVRKSEFDCRRYLYAEDNSTWPGGIFKSAKTGKIRPTYLNINGKVIVNEREEENGEDDGETRRRSISADESSCTGCGI